MKHASQKPGCAAPDTASRRPSIEMNASESEPMNAFISSLPMFAAMSCSRVSVSMP